MARTVTLAQLKTDIGYQADVVLGAGRYTPAMVTRFINQSIQRFRERVSVEGISRYLVAFRTFTAFGATDPYPFQVVDLSIADPEVVRVFGIDVKYQNTWHTLEHRPFADHARYSGPAFTELPSAWCQMQTDQVALLPPPDSEYPLTVWYLPVIADLASDSDTFDGVAGWEEYVIWDVVCRLLNRDQYLEAYQMAAQHREEVWADVMRGATVVSWMGPTVRGRDTMITEPRRYVLGSTEGPVDTMNPPAVGQAGYVAIARNDGDIDWTPGVDDGDDLKWNGSIWVQRRGWLSPSIDCTGSVDATAAIQAALNSRVGCCVSLPDGNIKVASSLTIPAGMTLTGSPQSWRGGPDMFTPYIDHAGTTILSTNTSATDHLFDMGQNSQVLSLGVHYPNQETYCQANHQPTPLGWTFYMAAGSTHGCAVQNVYVTNPYQLAFLGSEARIDNIYSYPLKTGIQLGRVPDVARLSNIHFQPAVLGSTFLDSTLRAWVLANSAAFIVDGADQFDMNSCGAYGYQIGLWLNDFDGDGWLSYGQFTNGGFDTCVQCIVSHDISMAGLKVVASTIVPATGGWGAIFEDSATPASAFLRPTADFIGCHFGGGAQYDRAVWMQSNSYAVVNVIGGGMVNFTAYGMRTDGANALGMLNMVKMPTTLLGGAVRYSGTGVSEVNPISI